jgi:hypothetical protein
VTLAKGAGLLAATTLCFALTVVASAGAAADVQVTAVDCLGHPRRIAIKNTGDTAQNLTGWKLLSDNPNEVFDLGVAGTVEPGVTFYVFNGHLAPPEPQQAGSQWIYPWNYTPVLDESAFVLHEDGKDFIRLVDATQYPWREVSPMPCPGTTEIPPLEQPATPTPPPNAAPDAGGNSGQTDSNQATSAQTDGAQSTGASQNVPASGNTAATSGTGTTAQTGNVSAAAGAPESGAGSLRLQVSGEQRLSGPLLPLGVLGVIAGVALALVGARILRRALRRP